MHCGLLLTLICLTQGEAADGGAEGFSNSAKGKLNTITKQMKNRFKQRKAGGSDVPRPPSKDFLATDAERGGDGASVNTHDKMTVATDGYEGVSCFLLLLTMMSHVNL